MSDHESSNERLEEALRQLTPSVPAINRDRLLFGAGKASGRRSLRRLALLAALMGAGIGMAGTYLGLRTSAPPAPQVIFVHVPAPVEAQKKPEMPAAASSPSPAPSTTSTAWESFGFTSPAGGYLQRREQVLRWGVEALPGIVPSTADGSEPQPMNVLKMQSELIDKASDF